MPIRSPKPSRRDGGRLVDAALAAAVAVVLFTPSVMAQSTTQPAPPQGKPPADAAPPATGSDPPKDESLSDRLQRDDGVIRPPGNIAPDNTIVPNDAGRLRVIPPPGSPRGDPKVQPK